MFNATLDSVTLPGEPGAIDINVTYLDTDHPNWRVSKTLRVTLDPDLGPLQQRAAIRAQIIADGQLHRAQNAVYAGLKAMEGDSIVITPP